MRNVVNICFNAYQIKDDAKNVKRDESDQNLSKHWLQVHVTAVKDYNREEIAWNHTKLQI